MKKTVFISTLLLAIFISGCASNQDHSAAAQNEYSKIIAARIFIEPEHIDEFTTLFQELIDLTLQEPGCTGYELFQCPYDPTNFLVFETYINQEAVEAHFDAPYFAEYGEKIGKLASRPAEIIVYDVAGEMRP